MMCTSTYNQDSLVINSTQRAKRKVKKADR